jgi:hypothetical protein
MRTYQAEGVFSEKISLPLFPVRREQIDRKEGGGDGE